MPDARGSCPRKTDCASEIVSGASRQYAQYLSLQVQPLEYLMQRSIAANCEYHAMGPAAARYDLVQVLNALWRDNVHVRKHSTKVLLIVRQVEDAGLGEYHQGTLIGECRVKL